MTRTLLISAIVIAITAGCAPQSIDDWSLRSDEAVALVRDAMRQSHDRALVSLHAEGVIDISDTLVDILDTSRGLSKWPDGTVVPLDESYIDGCLTGLLFLQEEARTQEASLQTNHANLLFNLGEIERANSNIRQLRRMLGSADEMDARLDRIEGLVIRVIDAYSSKD